MVTRFMVYPRASALVLKMNESPFANEVRLQRDTRSTKIVPGYPGCSFDIIWRMNIYPLHVPVIILRIIRLSNDDLMGIYSSSNH